MCQIPATNVLRDILKMEQIRLRVDLGYFSLAILEKMSGRKTHHFGRCVGSAHALGTTYLIIAVVFGDSTLNIASCLERFLAHLRELRIFP